MKLLFLAVFLLLSDHLFAQPFRFAHVTDTHIGSETGAEDLRRTVLDINQQADLEFVILSGDITEFGSDTELQLAQQILDSLLIPYYIVPGNHDANWSESGGNSFRRIFGSETFYFTHKGFRFAGTNSGPNMRMGPGQIPRENLVWLDSVLKADPTLPLIYVNHYPQDSSLNNWYEAIDLLKQYDVRLLLCGHGHVNKQERFEGIPSIMGRSNLRAKAARGGYNLVTIQNDSAYYRERIPDSVTLAPWAAVGLVNQQFAQKKANHYRPDYSINERYPQVKALWTYQDSSDVGAGLTAYKKLAIAANTNGEVYALDLKTGNKQWQFQTGGKVYSTPEVGKGIVVIGSTDGYIYGINAKNGQLRWKLKTDKAVLGSPLIRKGTAYIGASDGRFRAIDIRNGRIKWAFEGVRGYVSAKPLFYRNKIYFGSWGNDFYALDAANGRQVWEWSNGSSNRMFSPAACYPVAANKRVFIVAPDRFMTALDAESGAEIWRKNHPAYRVRESMGLSADGKLVYAKTMDGELIGVSTEADTMEVSWKSTLKLPYELAPSAIAVRKQSIFVPSHSGLISAVHAKDGLVKWQFKLTNCLVNPMLPLRKGELIGNTMDGKVIKLAYP